MSNWRYDHRIDSGKVKESSMRVSRQVLLFGPALLAVSLNTAMAADLTRDDAIRKAKETLSLERGIRCDAHFRRKRRTGRVERWKPGLPAPRNVLHAGHHQRLSRDPARGERLVRCACRRQPTRSYAILGARARSPWMPGRRPHRSAWPNLRARISRPDCSWKPARSVSIPFDPCSGRTRVSDVRSQARKPRPSRRPGSPSS